MGHAWKAVQKATKEFLAWKVTIPTSMMPFLCQHKHAMKYANMLVDTFWSAMFIHASCERHQLHDMLQAYTLLFLICSFLKISFSCFEFVHKAIPPYLSNFSMRFDKKCLVVLDLTECDRGSFGKDCASSCGRCMDNETCHHVNGSCINGCETGFQGLDCKRSNIFSLQTYLKCMFSIN